MPEQRLNKALSEAEVLALPEQSLGGNIRVSVDPTTGLSNYEREPVQFLVNRDVVFYTLSDNSRWTVGETADGKQFRMRFNA